MNVSLNILKRMGFLHSISLILTIKNKLELHVILLNQPDANCKTTEILLKVHTCYNAEILFPQPDNITIC